MFSSFKVEDEKACCSSAPKVKAECPLVELFTLEGRQCLLKKILVL